MEQVLCQFRTKYSTRQLSLQSASHPLPIQVALWSESPDIAPNIIAVDDYHDALYSSRLCEKLLDIIRRFVKHRKGYECCVLCLCRFWTSRFYDDHQCNWSPGLRIQMLIPAQPKNAVIASNWKKKCPIKHDF